jgi:hypothetical protein
MAPHGHLVVDVTVTSARTNPNVLHIGASLPLPDILALGAQHGKLDADLSTSALLGTTSVQSVHDYYPFTLEDGGRLAPMVAELVDRMAILVEVRRFLGMAASYSRSLRFDMCPHATSGLTHVRMQHFVRRSTSAAFRIREKCGGRHQPEYCRPRNNVRVPAIRTGLFE